MKTFISEEYFVTNRGFPASFFLITIDRNINAVENHEIVVLVPFKYDRNFHY